MEDVANSKLKLEIAQLQDQNTVLEERLKLLQEEFDKPVVCVRCGCLAANHAPKVDEAILKEYFKSILAQKPFSHTYKLLDGRLLINFSSQYGTDIRDLDKIMINSIQAGKTVSDIQAEELMLVTSLTDIQCFDEENVTVKKLYEATPEQRREYATDPEKGLRAITESLDRITYQLVRRTFQKFAVLCTALSAAAEDENFYKGVGLL